MYYMNMKEENAMKTTKIAAFDVDAQKGFTPLCPDELPVPGGHLIVDGLNAMARLSDLRVASKDSHTPQALWVVKSHDQMCQPTGLKDADLTWVSHCVPGTVGHQSLDGLPSPTEYDFMVYKGIEPDLHPYGACYHDLADTRSTGVIEFLLANQVSRVLVGGLALEFCVATTAMQLLNAGFEVVLYLPACRALNDEAGVESVVRMKLAGISIAATETELDIAARG
jgi:nicotinamidase/pyrazinamidase